MFGVTPIYLKCRRLRSLKFRSSFSETFTRVSINVYGNTENIFYLLKGDHLGVLKGQGKKGKYVKCLVVIILLWLVVYSNGGK